MKLIKLIAELESICLIKGKHSEQEIKQIFVDENMENLISVLSNCIYQSKLYKPHLYRFKVQVHAEEIKKDLKNVTDKSS